MNIRYSPRTRNGSEMSIWTLGVSRKMIRETVAPMKGADEKYTEVLDAPNPLRAIRKNTRLTP